MELLVIAILIGGYFYFRTKKDNVDLSHIPKQFIVFDLETTGLNPNEDEIIEIGAIKVNMNSNEHQTFQALIKPKKKISKKITSLTKISQKMVDEDGENIENILSEFVDFIGDLRLVAFNSDFDMEFLKQASKEHNITINNPVSCALKMSRRAWKNQKSYKLVDIAKIGGFSTSGNHRALKDCELTIPVYTAASSILKSVD